MKRRGLTLIEVFIVVCLVVVAMAYLLGASVSSRARQKRIICASNQKQIAMAILMYANEYKNYMPAYRPPQAPEGPYIAKLGPNTPSDVTASMCLLDPYINGSWQLFVCPATDRTPAAGSIKNFASEQNLSYSMLVFYTQSGGVRRMTQFHRISEIAHFADMNPGGAVTSVSLTSTVEQTRTANSKNHGGNGQNVTYLDGRTEWHESPFAGRMKDNIYTVSTGEVEGGTSTVIAGFPAWDGDSVLLPVATQNPASIESATSSNALWWVIGGGVVLLLILAVVVILLLKRKPKIPPMMPPMPGYQM